jgi:hypothetical protein
VDKGIFMRSALTFLSEMGRKLVTDLLPAALASGIAGLVFSHLLSAPNSSSPEVARMVHDAHEIVLDYSRKEEDLRRQMAASSVAVHPIAQVSDRDAAPLRDLKPAIASAPRSASVKRTDPKLAAAGASKPSPIPEPAIEKQPGEPLVLSNFTILPPAPGKPEGFFAGTWKGIALVAKKVPNWAGSAADFVLELPARAIPWRKPSPESDFLKVAM